MPTVPAIHIATVLGQRGICRDHHRLTMSVPAFSTAEPGQFIHLSPEPAVNGGYRTFDWAARPCLDKWIGDALMPMLRRAYSIAGLRHRQHHVELDLIYRVVGTATQWMKSLKTGDRVSVLGPLGNRFPIREHKSTAWLVSGGVGLPPMPWLAESLSAAGRRPIAFCGALRAELLALTLDEAAPVDPRAQAATLSSEEFAAYGVPLVVSTDDGSLGFRGNVVEALAVYHAANPISSQDVVVYTCGPEPMMRSVARYSASHGLECYVCMERAMACGLGTCQSCVVSVRGVADPLGWRYELCCTEGPVLDASQVIWDTAVITSA